MAFRQHPTTAPTTRSGRGGSSPGWPWSPCCPCWSPCCWPCRPLRARGPRLSGDHARCARRRAYRPPAGGQHLAGAAAAGGQLYPGDAPRRRGRDGGYARRRRRVTPTRPTAPRDQPGEQRPALGLDHRGPGAARHPGRCRLYVHAPRPRHPRACPGHDRACHRTPAGRDARAAARRVSANGACGPAGSYRRPGWESRARRRRTRARRCRPGAGSGPACDGPRPGATGHGRADDGQVSQLRHDKSDRPALLRRMRPGSARCGGGGAGRATPGGRSHTPYLETLSRVDEQLEFVLARDLITIGRGLDNDIVIDDQFMGWQTVSPRHAELRRTPNGFVLRDLNSENGTFVNSARTGENLLQDGMTLAFGKVEFIYRVPTE